MLQNALVDCVELPSFKISVVHEFGKGPSLSNISGNDVCLHTRRMHSVADVPMSHIIKCPIIKDGIQKLINENPINDIFEIRIVGSRTLLTHEGVWTCINSLNNIIDFEADSLSVPTMLSVFASANVLHIPEIARSCEIQICRNISWGSVGVAFYAANLYKSDLILEAIYFFFRNAIIQGHVSASWLLDALPTSAQALAANVARAAVQLGTEFAQDLGDEPYTSSNSESLSKSGNNLKDEIEWIELPGQKLRLSMAGMLDNRGLQTPLKILQGVATKWSRRARLLALPTPTFTLTKLLRKREFDGGYPHIYTIVNDHDGEIILRVVRPSEGGDSFIYAPSNDSDSQIQFNLMHGVGSINLNDPLAEVPKEVLEPHCPLYRGKVKHQYLGTVFKAYDNGSEPWMQEDPLARAGLPGLDARRKLAEINYEPNVVGDCPRKIFVDLKDDMGKTSTMQLDNVQPRWDVKLRSYALPFFGRVLKASAKNFNLKTQRLNLMVKKIFFLCSEKYQKTNSRWILGNLFHLLLLLASRLLQ